MKKQIVILLLIIIFINHHSTNAMEKIRKDDSSIYLPMSYVNNSFSGWGLNSATSYNFSSAGTNNPAALSDIEKYTFNVSYQFESKIPDNWIAGINYKRHRIEYPQNLSLIIPYDNFRISAGFVQKYNANTDYGQMEGTKVANNELGYITVIQMNPSKQVYVNNFFLGSSYSFVNLFIQKDRINIGIQINYNTLKTIYLMGSSVPNDTYWKSLEYDETTSKTNFMLGVNYEIVNNNNVRFKTGISYQSQTDFSWTKFYDGSDVEFVGSLPEQYTIGYEIDNFKAFDFAFSMTQINWSKLSSGLKSTLNFSLSSTYAVRDDIKLSCGILTHFSKYTTDSYYIMEKDYDAYYLMLGGAINLGTVGVDLCVADSHLFSGIKTRQTIGKISFLVQF